MSNDGEHGTEPAFPWDLGVYDAHCHPTDIMASIDDVPHMKARVLTVMATRLQDQELVMGTNQRMGLSSARIPLLEGGFKAKCQILPAFGWHPWFSHQLYDDLNHPAASAPTKRIHYRQVITPSTEDDDFINGMPDPLPLSKFLERTKAFLNQCPLAMVGEIGLDRSFRIPETTETPESSEIEPGKTPGGRDGRKLSSRRVELKHQQAILTAQLKLAGEMGRAVSVHGVAAHGFLFETLRDMWKGHERHVPSRRERARQDSAVGIHAHEEEDSDGNGSNRQPKPYPPRICLHSYSGSSGTIKQYLHPSVPATIFFSFSKAINFSTTASDKAVEAIRSLPADRILVESDLHCAGDQMDQMLEDMIRLICNLRGWDLDEGVRQLGKNWKKFAFGHA